MLTLIGDTNLEIKNPKVGNLETVDLGVALNVSRQGVVSTAIVAPVITRRRFDFQWLTEAQKETLDAWLNAHLGRAVTIQWTSDENGCNENIINEQYIIDDQLLEFVTLKDQCSYDCIVTWVKA